MKRRRNFRLFKNLLDEYNIHRFYHFTDRSNITSIIKNGGLFSWASCEYNHIKIQRSGGSELSRYLDTKLGIEDYVRISLCKYHPMMYSALADHRISDPVILEIDPDILYIDGNIFSNKNAIRSDARRGSEFEDFASIHFSTTQNKSQFDVEENERDFFQAEILVKNHIPLHYITNINEFIMQELVNQDIVLNGQYNSGTSIHSHLIVFLLNQTIVNEDDNSRDIILRSVLRELEKLYLINSNEQYDVAIIGYGNYAHSLLKGQNIVRLNSVFSDVDGIIKKNYEIVDVDNNNCFLHKGLLLSSYIICDWITNHNNSNPPIVIHISPHGYNNSDHADIISLSQKIKSYQTDKGYTSRPLERL